jgi:endonuclease/exonuclease/phosphatase (EEP) superfamily protein YafD
MKFYEVILLVLNFIFITLTFLPLIKSPKWFIRVWDYPRFQLFGILAVLILCSVLFMELNRWENISALILLVATLIYLGWIVFPYTIFAQKMVVDANKKSDSEISLLTSNVYQHNRNYQKTLELISQIKPDVFLLLETDRNWMESMQSIKKDYPFFIEIPKENTYGMLFYSKIPVEKHEINYLIDEEIPSIIVDVNVDGEIVRLYGIHPTPPVPQENPESTERDAEILIVGKKSKNFDGPSIVFGDLNDVAWSHTTRLFLRISGMLDPRIGRGMFNTFHAKYWFFRWPLDHFFVSSHFRLLDLKVEKSIGSDHFPISIKLVISHEDKEKELDSKPGDYEEAQEIIEDSKT